MLHGSGCRTASHFELFRRLLPGGTSGSGRGRMRGPVRPTRALRAAIAILSSLATVATALVATAAAVLPLRDHGMDRAACYRRAGAAPRSYRHLRPGSRSHDRLRRLELSQRRVGPLALRHAHLGASESRGAPAPWASSTYRRLRPGPR